MWAAMIQSRPMLARNDALYVKYQGFNLFGR